MRAERYYDMVSRLYDPFARPAYARARRRAVQELRLSPGFTVFDLACGTGLNFPLLEQGLGPPGRILALDYSAGMLRQAAARIERNEWTNITLVHEDARNVGPDLLQEHLGNRPPDALLCTLGLSVVPDWELAFDKAFSLIKEGGRSVVMDGRTLGGLKGLLNPAVNFLVKLTAAADIRREVWKPLEGKVNDFRISHFLLGYVFVASGTKPYVGSGVDSTTP